MKDYQFKTLASPVEGVLFKERKSKFIGHAYPVQSEEEIEQVLDKLRKTNGKANHICYAWQLGTDPVHWRANDDGEPNNSAGLPIYGQIQAFGLTDVMLAVVRYFGGTKLGVGGLISAYKTTALMTLEEGLIIAKTLFRNIEIEFEYSRIHQVMRLIKGYGIEILSQENGTRAKYVLGIPELNAEKVLNSFGEMDGLRILP